MTSAHFPPSARPTLTALISNHHLEAAILLINIRSQQWFSTKTSTNTVSRAAREFTTDKKYYQVRNSFIKRTLRRHEWMQPTSAANFNWTPSARIQTPRSRACSTTFEDDGAFYFSTAFVPGVPMIHCDEVEMKHLLSLKERLEEQ